MNSDAEMPRYQCHKKVRALKIKCVDITNRDNDAAKITPEDSRFAPFYVPRSYLAAHQPQVGGYFVVYDDGYKSFSPADAFEGGYTLIKAA